jgi:hypothetical protein
MGLGITDRYINAMDANGLGGSHSSSSLRALQFQYSSDRPPAAISAPISRAVLRLLTQSSGSLAIIGWQW